MSNDHEWLKLIEVSGPFLEVPVLREAFPQGLDALASGKPQRLRRTYEEWRDAVDVDDVDLTALHAAWIDEVLLTALEMDGAVLRRGTAIPDRFTVAMPEHGVSINADLAVVNPTNGEAPLLLIHVYEPDTDLDATRRFEGLAVTPSDRMVTLLRGTGCPTGLVTNGECWRLVHAPVGASAGFASWYSRYWGAEPETLRAFVSLLGVRRFFGPDEGKLPSLYERSLKHQDDVTEALGEQVRRAVEVLIQALDRADQDRNRELLRDVDPKELYEAGLTVMMRLVFLLAAEERGLLLLGDPRYDAFYAISSLRTQLRADSEEILERRRSAWSRLLALFRGVYGGIDHPTLSLPALGGSLFDPDRYPFLEGRMKGTSWRSEPAEPLPIDDRTVLLLLEAIQTFHGRTLSYRALDVEKIGHVYEGLLDRTVNRVNDVTLELDSGAKAKSPRVTLGEIESARLDSTTMVADLLKERSERSDSAIRKALHRATDDRLAARLLTVCRGDIGLRDRILPYSSLLRTDPWGYPLVQHSGAFVVASGTDRRDSGAHYTPKVLTEKIVQETLTPIVYHGPAQGKAEEEWELKSASELLDLKICDPAMGSGAFLVQVCRWLSDRLVEAWSEIEATGKKIDSEGRNFSEDNADGFEPLSQASEERAILARRLIAERCIYGVDMNPLAVELAKLSLWLTTMSKGRPFGFLDHNLRCGDSLLGIHNLSQLTELDMNPKNKSQMRLFGRTIKSSVDKALALRARLREIPIRDIRDVESMAALNDQSRSELVLPTLLADAFIGVILAADQAGDRIAGIETLAALADAAASGARPATDRLRSDASRDLAKDSPSGVVRRPFHWPLEFPEVFGNDCGGFDALIGNPPFRGGRKIRGTFGGAYLTFLTSNFGDEASGNADLCAFFFLQAHRLLNERGATGFLATNTIAEGDTRRTGLEYITKSGGEIFFAIDDFLWPGTASVTIAIVIFMKIKSAIICRIGDAVVNVITASLKTEEIAEKAHPLNSNTDYCFQGSVLAAKGFILSPEEADAVLKDNANNREVVFAYFTGDEIFNSAQLKPERFVINFFDWPMRKAEGYALPFRTVKERVEPVRAKVNRKAHRDYWWHYGDKRPKLYEKLSHLQRCIVQTRHTKYLCPQMIPTGPIFSESTVVFPTDDFFIYGLLNSTIHEVWARETSGSIGVGLRYTPTDCFYTFSLPEKNRQSEIRIVAEDFDGVRAHFREARGLSVNEMMDCIHNASDQSSDVTQLREQLVLLDRSVLEAFQWGAIDLDHGFHEVPYLSENDRIRFTISERARVEVLRSLAALNQRRHEEEVFDALRHAKTGAVKVPRRKPRAADSSGPKLDLVHLFPSDFEGSD